MLDFQQFTFILHFIYVCIKISCIFVSYQRCYIKILTMEITLKNKEVLIIADIIIDFDYEAGYQEWDSAVNAYREIGEQVSINAIFANDIDITSLLSADTLNDYTERITDIINER